MKSTETGPIETEESPLGDGEIDAMKKMAELLEPFSESVRLRMLKFVVAQQLRWGGVRFQRTQMVIYDQPLDEIR